MPKYSAPIRDFQFLLHDYLGLEKYKDIPGFADASPDLIDTLLTEGGKICEEVLFPLNQSGDAEGVHFKDGAVTLPKGFRQAYKAYADGGWIGLACAAEHGGQGLPEVVATPMVEMICSANLSFGITPGLSHGAYNALRLHATDDLKKRFMPNIASGKWSGVMGLTEPQCGTDLGLIRTTATPSPRRGEGRGEGPNDQSAAQPLDQPYAITGTKIFISSGEQDLTENIIHLVLARLPDAPKGIKGISLFLVPKILENGTPNGVKCSGVEHKMGIHASPTCVMNYENATGWLVGEKHKGMRAMFTMMNAARLYVGIQGLGLGEVAYQNALAYANERLQGRSIKGAKFPDKPADPIIVHPDVRRNLLLMRTFCEGGRALALETALMLDLSRHHPDAKEREKADDYVQLMTPIVKSWLTDGGFEITNLGMQIFGGMGYVRETGMEQYARDARIAQIYEGTNGIQALDLVGRKLSYNMGRYLRRFFHPASEFIEKYKDDPKAKEFVKPFAKYFSMLQQTTLWMAGAGVANPEDAMAAASEYLRLFALVVLGYAWCRMGVVGLKQIENGRDVAFHEAKLAAARFYLAKVLPQSAGLASSLTTGGKTIMAEKTLPL